MSTFKDYLREMAIDQNDPALTELLDAIANAIPFIGYESVDAHKMEERVSTAFQQYTGRSWAEWKKR